MEGMKIKILKKDHGPHLINSVHDVVKIIPHTRRQADGPTRYVLADGIEVRVDHAKVVEELTWNDALPLLDKSDPDWVSRTELASALSMQISFDYNEKTEAIEKRATKFWIRSWICTDTRVGLAFYFLDGEPVATSWQQGRKCDENIDFFSNEAAEKVREWLLSMAEADQPPIADLNEQIPANWFEGDG
jgi:hypothetical protein